jgi:hypothetical protein
MKTIAIFFFTLLLATGASTAVLYVDIYGHAQYTQVQPAINAASAGDTIVVGTGYGYQGFTVDRRLVIIGAGTSAVLTEATRIDGIVTIMSTADSTELQGLWIIASVNSGTDSLAAVLRIRSGALEVFVWRCFIENTNYIAFPSGIFIGNQSSAQFTQCVIMASNAYGHGIWTTHSGWATNPVSCVFATFSRCINATPGSGEIHANHCVLTNGSYTSTMLYVPNCTGLFENSAFLRLGGAPYWGNLGSVVLSYCAAEDVAPPGTDNIVCSTGDFVNLASYYDPRANDYHLSESSILRDAGNPTQFDLDSTRADIAVYGGMHPFVENGAPAYPFVLDVDVPTAVPQNGAVRVYARGRIGPGN